MQNDVQSSEIVILGVDTHLDIHVGAVVSIPHNRAIHI